MQLWQVRPEHDQPWCDQRRPLVGVVDVRVQVRVHCEEQGLQGEDEDVYQADPGHDRVNVSWSEQRLSGWLFPRLQAGLWRC